ncbi:hypothetical protein HED60_14175 [Planctomycetales bacterium ZRK34]|nr:hypothetical protein HED60_14175 [Planctomycetales bacterium ZRK34]
MFHFDIYDALLLAGIIGISVLLARHRHYKRKDRGVRMRAWAVKQGLTWSPVKDNRIAESFSFFCFQRGPNRFAENICRGRWNDRDIVALDYHNPASRKNQIQPNAFSALILCSAHPLQRLLLRPEELGDKLAAFAGLEDINFESAEFSRNYFVGALDRRWAYEVLHAKSIDWLLTHPGYSIEFDDTAAIIYRDGLFEPEDFQKAFDVLAGLLDMIPDYVKQQQALTSSTAME